MEPECPPCLLNRLLFQTDLVGADVRKQVMEDGLTILAREFHDANSAVLATKVHARAYKLIGVDDPYYELKLRSDEVAGMLYQRAEEFVEKANDTLEAAALCAIAGNVLDFGGNLAMRHPEALLSRFDGILAQGLDVNDLPQVSEILQEAGRVLYLFDNCGESVFDRLLIREIQSFGARVTGMVKGRPILTDVTAEDAIRVGLDDVLDEMVDTGGFAIGVDLDIMDESVREQIECTDLVVAKGMANFESLSDTDVRPIAYFMRAKCEPVARNINARKEDNVVRLYR